jgi:hypothetical protein
MKSNHRFRRIETGMDYFDRMGVHPRRIGSTPFDPRIPQLDLDDALFITSSKLACSLQHRIHLGYGVVQVSAFRLTN